MSWQTARRAAFHPGGPFLFKRNGHVGNIEVAFGDVVTAERLRDDGGLHPRQIDALYNGYWMDMAPGEAAEAPPEDTDTGGEGPDGVEIAPPAAADGPQGDEAPVEAPVTPPAAGEGSTALVAAACRAMGFGFYKFETADGVVFGDRMSKVEAEQSTFPLLPQLTKA